MRAVISIILGVAAGLVAFFVVYYNELLLVGHRQHSLLMTLELNRALDLFMLGGAVLGLIIGLQPKEAAK